MEDSKLEAYYNAMKASAPKAKRGALGFTGSRKQIEAATEEVIESGADAAGGSVGKNGLPNNPLYRRFVKPGDSNFKRKQDELESKKIRFEDSDNEGAAGEEPPKKRMKTEKTTKAVKPAAPQAQIVFKWKREVKALLKACEGRTMSVRQLRKSLIARYKEVCGGDSMSSMSKSELKTLVKQEISKIEAVSFSDCKKIVTWKK